MGEGGSRKENLRRKVFKKKSRELRKETEDKQGGNRKVVAL